MAVGWHESRELLQQPPHLLIRVQGGKIIVEGSSSSSFRETGCNSGIHLAGVDLSAFDRSSPSPNLPEIFVCILPNLADKISMYVHTVVDILI